METYTILAIDLGASSGRGILGRFDRARMLLETEEVYRFPNNYVRLRGGIYWDYVGLYNGILECLRVCRRRAIDLRCIAIDTWGQDYAYIGPGGEVLGLPRSYRDPVNEAHWRDLDTDLKLDGWELYKKTGGPAGSISTLRQLYYDSRFRSDLFTQAKYWLNMPYLFVYLLSDTAGYDVTLPALGEMCDAGTMDISPELAKLVGFGRMTPPRAQCGTVMARTSKTVLEATGYDAIPIACIDAHDTSSAVDAIPDVNDFLWISSGTFNMLGTVIREPVVNEKLFRMGCRNTPLGDGRVCMMCGAAGMYYIQQCVKYWAEHGVRVTYPELTAYALSRSTDAWFSFSELPSAPVDMPAELRRATERNGFPAPQSPEEVYEVFANSLARATAQAVSELESALERTFDKIYIVSGGSQADAVNARIARLTGKKLFTGLVEAASIGNLLFQLVAIGCITREQAAEVSANSFRMKEFSLPSGGQA